MDKEFPKWIKDWFGEFLDQDEQLHKMLHLNMHGISVLRGIPNAMELLKKLSTEDSDEGSAKTSIERAREEARLADEELKDGFPQLHAQASIALWGLLESSLRMFCAKWVETQAAAKEAEELKRVKIRWVEYECLSPEDRAFYLIDLLEESLSSRRSPGVGRFEALLRVFGLSSEISADARKTIFEHYHIRNVLVHRRGIADRKLVEACPWLAVNIGSTVIIKHDDYVRYHHANLSYVCEIVQRARVYFGLGRDETYDADVPPGNKQPNPSD